MQLKYYFKSQLWEANFGKKYYISRQDVICSPFPLLDTEPALQVSCVYSGVLWAKCFNIYITCKQTKTELAEQQRWEPQWS